MKHSGSRRHGVQTLRLAAAVLGVALIAALVPGGAAAAAADCSTTPSGAMEVTPDCVDPLYTAPVVDAETDETTPVPHHKVSGHFEGTDIRFNIYLPPSRHWQGRFFQYTYPLTNQNADDRAIGFAIASGGYAVQAGGSRGFALGYRYDAAAAKFAEQFAADYYEWGNKDIYGYLYGASGGSYQTVGAMENTHRVWDGYVPMVLAVPMSSPYTVFQRGQAELMLAGKQDQIRDAMLPGGSGDPYAGLSAVEQQVLREVTAFGVPLKGWEFPEYLLGTWKEQFPNGIVGTGGSVRASLDPTYADDFWSKDGYLGTEKSALGDAVRAKLAQLGDTEDNRWTIALRWAARHQVPPVSQSYYGFDQYRDAQGTPLYPQRAFLWGPPTTGAVAGNTAYDGSFDGKVIVVDNLYDTDALPWHADWYAKKVRSALGDAGMANSFRIYYNDHADHQERPVAGERAKHLVSWMGSVEQALRDVSAWAERGIAPPSSTNYTIDDQTQVVLPDDATARRGIQPTVDLSVAGSDRVSVRTDRRVLLKGKAETPPDAGVIVSLAWDCEGDGTYAPASPHVSKAKVTATTSCRYDAPGTYFPALRVTSQREGHVGPYAQVQNLDRVRVVVRG